jgi:hypothetical protein
LKRIDTHGGQVVTLADNALGSRNGTWNRDGAILFAPHAPGPLYRVESSGSSSSAATWLDAARGESIHRGPSFLPDGKHFLYRAGDAGVGSHGTIRAGSIASRESKIILEADSDAVFSHGYLLFRRESTLMAQPFDPERLVTTAAAAPVIEQVGGSNPVSVSDTGLLAFRTLEKEQRLIWSDRNGKQLSSLGEPAYFHGISVAPDGRHVAATVRDPETGKSDLWIYDAATGFRNRFTFESARWYAVWSPDSRKIVFSSNRKGHFDLYQKRSDGAGAEELLYADSLDKSRRVSRLMANICFILRSKRKLREIFGAYR